MRTIPSSTPTRVLALSAAVTFAVGLSACGDDVPTQPGGQEPSFSIILEGDVSRTLSGAAVFEESSAGHAAGFGIFAAGSQDEVQTFTLIRNGIRPSPGHYSLAGGTDDSPAEGMFTLILTFLDSSNDQVVLGSHSGTVTIEQSSPDRVRGSFQGQVVGASQSETGVDSATATVTGSFDAVSVHDFGGG